jgi:hypothetical protein
MKVEKGTMRKSARENKNFIGTFPQYSVLQYSSLRQHNCCGGYLQIVVHFGLHVLLEQLF